jgi:hypothetical protein
MTFSLIRLAEGLAQLRSHDVEILWLGRSRFLWAGCERAVPGSSVSVIGTSTGARQPEARRRVAIGFEADADTREWAARCGADLLMAPHATTVAVGDKTVLPGILRAADVAGIDAATFGEDDPIDTQIVRARFGDVTLVVQRAENNLTGTGTALVRSDHELAQVLANWRGHRLKVARHVDGVPLTVSGCVGRNSTIVTGLSRQLVGVPRLTSVWGAHCGNALLDPADLPVDTFALCTEACRRVGDELRQRGFLGAFGLDLLQLPNGRVVVVEINPRVQSVTSLISVAELESGFLPVPAVQILSFLGEASPVTLMQWPGRIPPLQQVVLYARRRGRLTSCPVAGSYALEDCKAVRVSDQMDLARLDDHSILLWPFAAPGDVEDTARLCVMQGRHPLVEPHDMALSSLGLLWVDAIDSLFHIES